jgi:hypothetical protein
MLTAVEEIESAILKLSLQELGKLAEWVLDLDEQNWDNQIERDVAAGKLDFLAKEALAELENGNSGRFTCRLSLETQRSQCLRNDTIEHFSTFPKLSIYVRSCLMTSPRLDAIDIGAVGFRFTLPNLQLSVLLVISIAYREQ